MASLATASLVKAYLAIVSGGAGAAGLGAAAGRRVTFKFNPTQYGISLQSNWSESPRPRPQGGAAGRTSAPEVQHLGTRARRLSLEIFLDESGSMTGDVSRDVETLMACCGAEPNAAGGTESRPPTLRFGWGTYRGFDAYLQSVSVTYTLFRPDGTPIRASCRIELVELPSTRAAQNPTSGTPAIHRVRTVVAGDSLASIAFSEYRQARYWRAIAAANEIDDPTRIRSGARIVVPPPEHAVDVS